ncbi:MAG: c-type cytochrome, partial [Anaerolineales bacterium]
MKSFFSSTPNLVKFISYSLILMLILLLVPGCDTLWLADDIVPPPGSELSAALPTQSLPAGPLYPLVPPDPLAGEPIYQESCAPCHGASGRGDGSQASNLPIVVKSLASSAVYRESTPAEWYSMITEGNLERFMPPFSSLSSRQRWDVVAYLYTLSTTPEETRQGIDLYHNNCAECHGAAGGGDGSKAVNLGTPATDFTDQAYMAKKSAVEFFVAISDGVGEDMPAFSDQLDETDRWTLATTLRHFTFTTAATIADLTENEVETTTQVVESLEQPDEAVIEAE